MKLKILHETVGHWRAAKGPYEFYGDPKNKRETDDLSFRLKGKKDISGGEDEEDEEDPEGGDDRTQSLETGAGPERGEGKIAGEYSQRRGPGNVKGA